MSDIIKITSDEEFSKKIEDHADRKRIKIALTSTGNCKIELLEECMAGRFFVPRKDDPKKNDYNVGFFVSRHELYLIGDKDRISRKFDDYKDMYRESNSSIRVFFDLLEYIIKDDAMYFQKYEERLEGLEESLLGKVQKDFPHTILEVRKELLAFQSYYQQLIDMADTVVEDDFNMVDDVHERLFNIYSKKADRLFDHVQRLKEYTSQLSELYNTQIDIRQNEIMKVLTIVTTIIMPLTLITGWYGMNFMNMPELASKYGYIVIIAICIIIVLLEIWWFKIKDWFK
ncbi:MAG: CorA family divalent cation transporter [Suipraeoptans sp.]